MRPEDREIIDEDELGEMVAIDHESPEVEDTEDGGAIVRLDSDDTRPADSEFYANLAENMNTSDLKKIATTLLELIERDKSARSKRDEQYAEGIKRTGLGNEAPGGADFEGASKVVHPMLIEGCVDFASRTIKELWPASGPVKTKIEGDVTVQKEERAERKAKLMNWQVTVQNQEFRAEVEQLLTQVPLGGAQYLKVAWDERRNAVAPLAIMIDDMLIPFAATNFYSAERKTHVQYLTTAEYQSRVQSGMYRDVDIVPTSVEPEATAAGKASDKIEGREGTSYNEDGLRTVFETYVTMQVGEDEEPSPYIITTDKSTNDVLSIYRNWEEDDQTRRELEWIVEFAFVPWRGAYPIGLPHMIGGLAAASTGALRALLDSAHINNTASGLKLKGAQVGGQNRSPGVGEITEIEGGLQVDDIRKVFMPMPYNPPSTVLFQLLGFLVDAGKGVIRTTLDDIADTNPNTPVGTTLARMEQGMVVFSAIHGRLHDAMGRVVRILHRLDRDYLDDEKVKLEVGEGMATRKDFTGPMDIVPVSDPNIFSEAQRYAQTQAVVQRSDSQPGLYDKRKVEERLLQTLKVPDYENLLMPATEPEAQNAVAENVAMSLGRPAVAFPEQDHAAHIRTHLAYYLNPMFGQNPLLAPAFVPALLQHLKEHFTLWYMQACVETVETYSGLDIDKALKHHDGDEDNRALDRLFAEASFLVGENAEESMKELTGMMQQIAQQAQQFQQPPPMDPMQAQISIAQAKVQQEEIKTQTAQVKAEGEKARMAQDAQSDAQRMQLEQTKLEQEGALKAAELEQAMTLQQRKDEMTMRMAELDAEIEAENMAAEERRVAAEIDAKMRMNEADNVTALTISQAEIEQDGESNLSTGTGIDP